ncbi:MAG: hypothetical protein EZS28_005313 [Streblomastix strix]|uniref:Uncharacterized protein n=1 Tax=Streblomastix strix TaxID=222440 RepID=A0A5J4WVX1_9EUKA|nr:MAG: hypothetical protein EZS28_005313 [Streblomastix strix]
MALAAIKRVERQSSSQTKIEHNSSIIAYIIAKTFLITLDDLQEQSASVTNENQTNSDSNYGCKQNMIRSNTESESIRMATSINMKKADETSIVQPKRSESNSLCIEETQNQVVVTNLKRKASTAPLATILKKIYNKKADALSRLEMAGDYQIRTKCLTTALQQLDLTLQKDMKTLLQARENSGPSKAHSSLLGTVLASITRDSVTVKKESIKIIVSKKKAKNGGREIVTRSRFDKTTFPVQMDRQYRQTKEISRLQNKALEICCDIKQDKHVLKKEYGTNIIRHFLMIETKKTKLTLQQVNMLTDRTLGSVIVDEYYNNFDHSLEIDVVINQSMPATLNNQQNIYL